MNSYISIASAIQQYLLSRYKPTTTKRYLTDIDNYLNHTPNANTATYSDIMEYIGHLRKHYSNGKTIQRILQAIKQYYHWLNHTGQRSDHPCRYINIKDRKATPIQLQELFTPKELEQLLQRKEHYQKLALRNRVIITLLIYQALTPRDIAQLEVSNINLDKGTIYIKSSTYTNSRTLPLQTQQIMLLHNYLTQSRPKLLKKVLPLGKDLGWASLIITNRGTPETGEGIQYLIETLKPLFPEKNLNCKTIRQSVIANHLKQGKDLRIVQHFAGHKYPSTTEKYRQTGIEALKVAIDKYHPLQEAHP